MKSEIGKIQDSIPKWLRNTFWILTGCFLMFYLVDLVFPFRVQVAYSQLILDRDGNLVHAFLSEDQKWRMKCSLEEVNPLLVKAFIQKEDRWFRYHPGFNPAAILRATIQNLRHRKRVSGASTITMQVVRLLEPRDRTHASKLIEMFRAMQIEFHYSKKEILELYLNLIPYGGNIEGIKAASFLYFGQKTLTLSPAQIVVLAVIPNNPGHLRIGYHNQRIREERDQWLARFQKKGLFNESDLSDALSEKLEAKRMTAPQRVPHLSLKLHNRYPEKTEIKSTIHLNLQHQLEELLMAEVRRLRAQGITNGAALIVNNRTSEVEAYVGSAGFYEQEYQGQVDGCSALRSPGSALKPFLYAKAIDNGLITPRTVLSDVPLNVGGYRPQNYDDLFRGQLTASQALALSLNVPAVELANRLGIDKFVSLLSDGDLKWIAKKGQSLGLSVVLGGCGVTLTELTGLFSAFACQGVYYPLQYVTNLNDRAGDTLFSKGSSWMVTEMLTNLKRPDLPNYFESSIHLPHIAWKTGTSYGRRDAWCIGYNPDYTVGVWVGNFDGRGVPDLSGSESAAPLLFRIFNLLTYNRPASWFTQPRTVDYRLVCSESGLPPNDFCENLVMDHYLPSVSPNRKCNHLAEVFTNPSGTFSYCRSCLPQQGYRSDFFANLSPSLISFYEEEHIPYRKIPPHNPECSRVFRDEDPVITSLNDGKEYILYSNARQQLQLSCAAAADVSKVYWYIDDVFYESGGVSEKFFFSPEAGRIKISCCDDKGRYRDVFILVRFV